MTCTLASSGLTQSLEKAPIELNTTNSVYLRGPITRVSIRPIIKRLLKLDKKHIHKPLYLVLSTPGGSIGAGRHLILAAQGLKRKVHTVSLFSGSMGFTVIQSLGTRYGILNSVYFIHSASLGSPSDNPLDKDFIQSLNSGIIDLTFKRSNGIIDKETLSKNLQKEWTLTERQALKYGFIDAIKRIKCSDKLIEQTYKDKGMRPERGCPYIN